MRQIQQPPVKEPVYPVYHNQPLRLTNEEIANPRSVLQDFFWYYGLTDIRQDLKAILNDALQIGDADAATHVHLHDNLEKLIEAAWLIHNHTDREAKSEMQSAINSPLQKIIRFLVETIAPERIFLLSENPFDLLIILSDHADKPYSFYETIIEMSCMNTVVHCSLHKSSEFNRQLTAGHTFYTIACTPEHLVYENGKTVFPVTPAGKREVLYRQAVERFAPGLSPCRPVP